MNNAEIDRISWHLDIPICSIKAGVKRHLAYVKTSDLRMLCRYYNCSVNEIVENFWTGCRAHRGKL